MATKTRRPVVMATPPPAKARSKYTDGEKQTLLDNFDLEVADKTRAFRASLEATLTSFSLRQETEIMRIPRELRNMTLGELEGKWGGSWAGTMQKIARDRVEAEMREREREEEEKKRETEAVKGKRKRATGNTLDSPERTSKNARRDATASASKQPLKPSSAANVKRKPQSQSQSARQKGAASTSSSSASKPPSSLPQNHVFNPTLPPTPLRALRQTDTILYSSNGSPLANPLDRSSQPLASSSRHHRFPSSGSSAAAENDFDSDSAEEEEDEDDASSDPDELPDPEVLEAKLLAKHSASQSSRPHPQSKSNSSSSGNTRKPKRAPSLIFQPSSDLVPPSLPGVAKGGEVPRASIALKDGRTMTFNPLDLSPGRMEEEMRDGGLDEGERESMKGRIREEVVKALASKMERWKVL